jgi:hypothetical protein
MPGVSVDPSTVSDVQEVSVRTGNLMPLALSPVGDVQELSLDALSEDVRISKQTLVTWVDRGLIEATLDWGGVGTPVRLIRIAPASLDFVRSFAAEYRNDTVSRTESRRLLKLIDRNQVQRLVRRGLVRTRTVGAETRLDVGSIEDYLRTLEAPGSPAD